MHSFEGARDTYVGIDQMHEVNRTAVLLLPRQPFVDWVNRQEPSQVFSHAEIAADPAVYLLDVVIDLREVPQLLHQLYEEVFEHQLAAWCTDQATWPSNRSVELFSEWFEILCGSEVIDLRPEMPFHDVDE